MRLGRQTTDKKDVTIQVRVNEEQKKHLDKKASRNNISVSQLVRILIAKDMQAEHLK